MGQAPTLEESEMQVIIKALKMNGFAFIEREALDGLNDMISKLPNPSQVTEIYQTPRDVERLCAEIGTIASVIDYYGTKGQEYRSRFTSLTKLPPRHKTLDYQKAANCKIIKLNKTGK